MIHEHKSLPGKDIWIGGRTLSTCECGAIFDASIAVHDWSTRLFVVEDANETTHD